MSDLQGIREHMTIIGADGTHVGTVDRVEGERIKLTRDDSNSGGTHHWLPLGMVDGVEGDTIRMSFVGALASQFWEAG